MRRFICAALLVLAVAGGLLTRKKVVAFDGPDPPPQCIPRACPPGR